MKYEGRNFETVSLRRELVLTLLAIVEKTPETIRTFSFCG